MTGRHLLFPMFGNDYERLMDSVNRIQETGAQQFRQMQFAATSQKRLETLLSMRPDLCR